MGDRRSVAEDRDRRRLSEPALRIAVLSMHTSPTASLGFSANGGLNVYVRQICSAFSDMGVATDVFTRRQDARAPVLECIAPRSRVIYLPAGEPGDDKYSLLESAPTFGRAVADHAAAEGTAYDLVYSHYWLSGVAAQTLSEDLEVPWAHTAHTLGLVKNRHLARGAKPEPPVRLQHELEIASQADLLVASTASEAADLVELLGADPNRVAVVPPGVDPVMFRPMPRAEARVAIGQSDRRLVLFVGRLERLKGVEIVLRAFALAADRRHQDARLVIVGEDSREGGERESLRLRSIAGELGILSRVEFVGSVAQHRLRAYYAAAEACMMPSYSESFGLVGLEAQACGCPVIAADVAGLRSVVRDGVTGYLVEGDNPAAYAERLGRILDDPQLSDQMGRRGTLLAQRFGWSRTAERLLGEFDDLIAAPQVGVQRSARHE